MANLSNYSPPPGYRFVPSDRQLLMYYLKRKVTGRKFQLQREIPDIALKYFSPSEVREMSYPKTKYPERFFFSSLGSRYSKGERKDCSGKGGFWKLTAKEKPIYSESRKVGWRRTRTFYLGKAPGTITDWHIHEYGLEGKNEFIVLCKIFEKKSRGPKTDEEYESPVEEDADDCVNGDDENGSLVPFLSAIPRPSIGPEEGQNTVATISALDFENRQDTVLQPLPPHTATPIVPQHHPSSPENDVHKLLLIVSDGDGDTCVGQVDSVPNKSTGEDVDTPEIYKNLGDIVGQREMNLLSPEFAEGGFLEEEDLKPKEDEGYFVWADFLIPMAMDSCDYENILGYREPTGDSAAHSPLKAGEIVGAHMPLNHWQEMSKENTGNAELPRNEASTSNTQPAKLLCEQEHHISAAIERGLELGTYKCLPINPDYGKWDLNERQMRWVMDAGLYHLAQMRWMRIDHALIMGLIERWRPETNTFHFPFGEATITLEDVAYIYGLPIDGPPVTGRTYTHYEIDDLCQELLGVVPQKKKDYNRVFLKFTWLERVFRPTAEELRERKKTKQKGKKKKSKGEAKKKMTEAEEMCKTRAYLFFLVAGQIFCNSSRARGPFYILELFREFRPYSWASACLANLYRMLNKVVHWEGVKKREMPDLINDGDAFEKRFKSLSGPLQLLQIWAYTRMKIGRGLSPNQHLNYDIQFPLMVTWANQLQGMTHVTTVREVRKQLNYITSKEFKWQPYKKYGKEFLKHVSKADKALFTTDSPLISYWVLERHPSPRVMRQFGLRQTVPPRFVRPIVRKENKERFVIDWSLVHEKEVKSWEARANNVLKRKGKWKGGKDEEEYMRWYEANSIMRIGCVRQCDEPQRDIPPQPDAHSFTVPQTRVSLFLDHVIRSCDHSIVTNVDLVVFITSIKKKVERFRSTFETPYEDYVETCSTSASEDYDNLTIRTPKRARIKEKSSKSPAKKPRLSINAPLMIEDSLIKASTSYTLDDEQTHEVDANNFDAAFSDVDDIPIEDFISVSPGPQGYNTHPKVTCQATIDSLIWRCKHIPRLRKISDRFLNDQHPLPQTGYVLTEVENELLMDFYKYFTYRKKELDMIISCIDSKSLRDLLDEGTWLDSSIIYLWFDVLRERCKDAYLADPSVCSLWEEGLKIGDDMAFGPKGEHVMDAMECKTLIYMLHAHNHWSLLVGYVDENRWEYYNSLKGEIWGQKTCERFRLWLQQRFMDHGWPVPMMWTITIMTDIPFQDNGNDCGLFACAFAEHCIYRRPIEFTQSDIAYYRRRIVIDIFEQNWIRNESKLNLPSLPALLPELQ